MMLYTILLPLLVCIGIFLCAILLNMEKIIELKNIYEEANFHKSNGTYDEWTADNVIKELNKLGVNINNVLDDPDVPKTLLRFILKNK